MPTKREREYYAMGFEDGFRAGQRGQASVQRMARSTMRDYQVALGEADSPLEVERVHRTYRRKPKRKLSAWQKYIKNKRNHIKYRDGKLNLKKMGVEFRRKKRR